MNAPCIRLQAATPSDLADWLDVLQQTRAAALARHGLTEGRCPPPPTPIAPSPPSRSLTPWPASRLAPRRPSPPRPGSKRLEHLCLTAESTQSPPCPLPAALSPDHFFVLSSTLVS